MFLIIDGSSLLTLYYYGTLPSVVSAEKDAAKQKKLFHHIRHTRNGIYTNAIAGTLQCILSIIQKQKPQHMAVVLDRSKDTFRRTMYPQYKANRPPKPEPLQQQFATLKKILNKIGILTLDSATYEADDLAGSIVEKFKGPYEDICLLTKDHDWLQLVDEYTFAWMLQSSEEKVIELRNKYYSALPTRSLQDFINIPNKTFRFDKNIVLAEEGVLPCQIPDLKGITGDSSDNIPGIKGVGVSAAAPLLREYGTVEALYREVESCKNNPDEKNQISEYWKVFLGVKRNPFDKISAGKENVFLSKKLATIVRTVPVPDSLKFYEVRLDKQILFSALSYFSLPELQDIAEAL